jgi:hypothetical protein
VLFPSVRGKDSEGKHYGSQVFPGSVSVVEAQVKDEDLDGLFEALETFRRERQAHRHLEAVVLNITRRL